MQALEYEGGNERGGQHSSTHALFNLPLVGRWGWALQDGEHLGPGGVGRKKEEVRLTQLWVDGWRPQYRDSTAGRGDGAAQILDSDTLTLTFLGAVQTDQGLEGRRDQPKE